MSAVPERVEVEYPIDNGEPLAESTLQFRWILLLAGNLEAVFQDRDDVFVGGDLLWYPVEGDNTTCAAPDVFAVFGRPKGPRKTYLQWDEAGVPMTVVIEILSASNKWREMADKRAFYDDYGVEEYIILDPEGHRMEAWRRGRASLLNQRAGTEYTSPRLGVRFDLTGPELLVFRPDGREMRTFEDVSAERDAAEAQASAAQAEAQAAQAEAQAAQAQASAAQAEAQAAQAQASAAQAEAQAAQAEAQAAQAEAHAAQTEAHAAQTEARAAWAAATAAQQLTQEAERREAAAQQFAQQTERRMQRMAELAARVAAGTATAEEVAEFHALIRGN